MHLNAHCDKADQASPPALHERTQAPANTQSVLVHTAVSTLSHKAPPWSPLLPSSLQWGGERMWNAGQS